MSGRGRLALFAALGTMLSTAALGAVFDSLSWLLPVAGAIAIVAGAGELCRRAGLSVVVSPFLAAAGVLVYVTALFARGAAVAYVVPGPGALRALHGLAQQGFADIQTFAPPVPATHGLVLITVVGVALVALVVDLVAVTLRQAALAGLPLLALFAVPAAVVPSGVGWLAFAIGGVGYLGLLLADSRDRLARWGRTLGATDKAATAGTLYTEEYGERSLRAAVGRRIGAAALGVAILLPALVPGLHSGLLGSGAGSGLPTTGGSGTVATYNPIARLKGYLVQKTPRELLRVTTSDPDPGYLRMAALDVFDGTTWSESPLSVSSGSQISKGRLPAPDGLTSADSTEISTQVKVSDLDVHWLPVPFPATNVKVKGWNYDQGTDTIFSTRFSTRQMSYSVVSRRVNPDPAQLRQAPAPGPQLDRFLRLPPLPEQIVKLVAAITGKSSDEYSKAMAIQSYFRTGFTYSLSVPAGNSDSDLVNFLQGRAGFCEQFAAAMAIFARQAGIPARVAVGFTRGVEQRDGSWKVTTADAHSWPELYFSGAGWLRFEPTPLGQGRAVDPSYTVTPGGSTGGPGGTTAAGVSRGSSATSGLTAKLNREPGSSAPAGVPPQVSPRAAAGAGTRDRSALLLGMALLALALAAFPATARAVVRRRRWSRASTPVQRAHAAWADLREDAEDLGHGWSVSQSPRAAGARLIVGAGLAGPAAEAVRLLVRAEERAHYAHRPVPADPLPAAVARVRAALRLGASTRRRWQARLVPPTGLQLARSLVTRAGDGLEDLDLAASRLRARLFRRSSPA